MPDLKDVIGLAITLSEDDRKKLITALNKTVADEENNIDNFLIGERFANGRVCPHCGSTAVSKNGHQKDGTQRYICKDCRKSFVATTNSIAFGTRKDLGVWREYINYMILGLSLRETARLCEISCTTAFAWRHKILDALQYMADDVVLDGIVEADETFYPISYKGNHKKSKTFKMPRPARRTVEKDKKRGISKQKVCVLCAVNRNGLSIAKIGNLGRASANDLHFVFDNRIHPNAVLCTDGLNSYRPFAEEVGLKLVQTKGIESRRGEYNIQHINSYHSKLTTFLNRFRGVSSKYFNNYLVWHNFANYAKNTPEEKQVLLLRFALATPKKVTNRQIPLRNPLPIST